MLMQLTNTTLHRQVWQRLPRTFRRDMLFRSLALIAPRPRQNIAASLPIIVAGSLSKASGLGESARLCHDALKSAGLPVYGIDLTTALMQSPDRHGDGFEDGRGLTGPGTLIVHVNGPLMPMAMVGLGRSLVRDKRVIGYWHWELPGVPQDWRRGVAHVNEIWAPTRFTAAAFEPIAAGRPVRVIAHPVALRQPRERAARRPDDNSFTVLTILNAASNLTRKNPWAIIEAFRAAFGADPTARLVVKVSNLAEVPGGADYFKKAGTLPDNIVIIDSLMSPAEMDALYDTCDVVVSLHRSEGFGLVLAEGMLRGLPVVGTNWSGNTDFLDGSTGVPVDFRLVPTDDPIGTYSQPGMQWAEPDVEAAAAALRRLRGDPALRRQLGDAARRFAARAWSADVYATDARRHLGLG